MRERSRRAVLQAYGAGLVAGLAGCPWIDGSAEPPDPPVSPGVVGDVGETSGEDWTHPDGDARGSHAAPAADGPRLDGTSWRRNISGGPITVVGTTVYMDTSERFYALDRDSGATRWGFEHDVSADTVAIANEEALFLAIDDGRVFRYAGDAVVSRTVPVGRNPESVVTETGLYLAADEELYALDPATLEVTWRTTAGDVSFGQLVATDEYVVLGEAFPGESRYRIEARRQDDPEILWERTLPYSVGQVALDGDRCVAAGSSRVTALDVADGATRWEYRVADFNLDYVAVLGEELLLQCDLGDHMQLRSLDPATGEERFTRDLRGDYRSFLATGVRRYLTVEGGSVLGVEPESTRWLRHSLDVESGYSLAGPYAVTDDVVLVEIRHFEAAHLDELVCLF